MSAQEDALQHNELVSCETEANVWNMFIERGGLLLRLLGSTFL